MERWWETDRKEGHQPTLVALLNKEKDTHTYSRSSVVSCVFVIVQTFLFFEWSIYVVMISETYSTDESKNHCYYVYMVSNHCKNEELN
jgi:hypothetical protein